MKMKQEIMPADKIRQALTIKDLSDPQNGIHALNLVIDRIRRSLF
jgi:hypothetical protein